MRRSAARLHSSRLKTPAIVSGDARPWLSASYRKVAVVISLERFTNVNNLRNVHRDVSPIFMPFAETYFFVVALYYFLHVAYLRTR